MRESPDGKDSTMIEAAEATRTLSAKSAKSTKSSKECASRSDTAFGIREFTEEVVDSNDTSASVIIKDVKKGATSGKGML